MKEIFYDGAMKSEYILMSDALHRLKYGKDISDYLNISREEALEAFKSNPKGVARLAMVLDLFIERNDENKDAWFRGDLIKMTEEFIWSPSLHTFEERVFALVTCPQVMLDHGVILRSNDLKVL